MKKLLSNLFGQPKTETATPKPMVSAPPPATAGKKADFTGTMTAFAVSIQFPEYAELAPLLSPEAHRQFVSDFKKMIHNALHDVVYAIDISDAAVASIAIELSQQQNPNVLLGKVHELYIELRGWVGTFGRIALPPMKYGIGVARGEMTVEPILAPVDPSKNPPPKPVVTGWKISGPALEDALHITKKFCAKFDVRLGVSGEIVRSSTETVNWFDLDDIAFGEKPQRVFTRIADRVDPADIQMMRAARKAYINQNWDEAAAKFDRLTIVPHFKHVATLYCKRVEKLRAKGKIPDWDGVYRS